MAWNGWKWMEWSKFDENYWKCLELLEMTRNEGKMLGMAGMA